MEKSFLLGWDDHGRLPGLWLISILCVVFAGCFGDRYEPSDDAHRESHSQVFDRLPEGGLFYTRRDQVPRLYRSYQELAEAGNGDAYYAMALFVMGGYVEKDAGVGIRRDLVAAYMKKASNLGCREADDFLSVHDKYRR